MHATGSMVALLLAMTAVIPKAWGASPDPDFTASQGWILVHHGSPREVQKAIAEYDEITREIHPGVFRIELHPQRDGRVAVLLPDGLPAYDLVNMTGWLDTPPEEIDAYGANAWIVSPTTGTKYSLMPEVANTWGDTMLGGTLEGASIRIQIPEGSVSEIPQRVPYLQEPRIDLVSDPIKMNVTLDTNTQFGNPGFVVDK